MLTIRMMIIDSLSSLQSGLKPKIYNKKVRKMSGPYHGNEHSKAENDNHANQLNPNNDAYWDSRGEEMED